MKIFSNLKIKNIDFSSKVILAYIISLVIVITVVVYQQITQSVQLLEDEIRQNLDVITNQVAMNFEDFQENVAVSMYSRLRAFEVPADMANYEPGSNLSRLYTSMSQTISESSAYDFVMLELPDGERIYTRGTGRRSVGDYNRIIESMNGLLDETGDSSSAGTWRRTETGDIYVVRSIYSTEPLKYVGRGVFHMRSKLFAVADTHGSTGFLFYDKNWNYLTSAGNGIDEEARKTVEQLAMESDDGREYFVKTVTRGSWVTIGYTSTEAFTSLKNRVITGGIGYGVLGISFGLLLMMLLLGSLSKKLRALQNAMVCVANGDLKQRVEVTDSDDISRMADTFNYMTGRLSELLDEVVEKERQRNDAEFQILEYKYRSLETQIRPHFIFNALEVVNSMAKLRGDTELIEVVQRISRYFRNITINTTKQFITTQQEFEALEDYTEIYKFIHGDRLHTVFRAKDNARNAMIPTMIVQPMVENALKHGLRSKNEDSEIIVHAYIQDDMLLITIKDNGHGLTEEQLEMINSGGTVPATSQSGIGVGNVYKRLQLLYGGSADISVMNRDSGGAMVQISIPLSFSEPDTSDDWDDD